MDSTDHGSNAHLTSAVRTHPAFVDLDARVLSALLADGEIVTYASGDALMRQGEASDCALVLLDGAIAVVAQTEFGLETLSELSGVHLLGDVGVYAQLPRSATILARTPARALRVPRSAMMRLCHDAPDIPLHVIRQLGARLNAFNQAIATYADALAALDAQQGDPAIVDALLNPPPELTNFGAAFRRMAHFIAQQRQQREEMASAAAIQTALLPFPLPVDSSERFHLSACIKPARHVGGDFFDALLDGSVDSPDHVVVTMGDVSGKGVPAALFATVCQMVMRPVLADGTDLGASLTRANALIASANREGMFATFLAVSLAVRTGELRFCNAGHVWPMIRRADGRCEVLRSDNLPLAVLDDAAYDEQQAHLFPGDALVLCTDGVTEAMDASGAEFGQDRLLVVVGKADGRGQDPAAVIVAEVEAFSAGTEQFDDICCLVLYRS